MKSSLCNLAKTMLVLVALACSGAVSAQASRTWVSGVGDDANPCSRTAPCKTYAGAISKTAAGGVINALDGGGFGAVTITKSITLDGTATGGGILVAGTNGVTINAPADTVIVLRNIQIVGLGSGLNGVNFIGGGALHLENVTVSQFALSGLNFAPTGASELFVTNSTFENNLGAAAVGIQLKPGVAGSAVASIDNVRLVNNVIGISLEAGANSTISNCVVSGNGNNGAVVRPGAGLAQLSVDQCSFTGNGNSSTSGGLKVVGAGALINLSGSSVSNNTAGLVLAGGSIVSFGNNSITGNGTDGNPSSTISQR